MVKSGLDQGEPVPIRVLVVDDHDAVRSGLAALLQITGNMELVGEATNGAEALQLCAQLEPDVALMDLVMPVMDGVEAIRAIRQICPQTRIIALTSFGEERLVRGALEAGAIAFLMKDVSADELTRTIQAAYDGQPTLAPQATQILTKTTTQPPASIQELTPFEQKILMLMAQGIYDSRIARQLSLASADVSRHVNRILSKLGAASRAEAIAVFYRAMSEGHPGGLKRL